MLEDIKKKIKEDNPHLADYDIKDYQVWDFVRLNEELSNCRKCKGIDNCPNSKRGFSPILTNSGDISYVRCKYYLKEIDAKSKESKLGLMYMPKDVLNAKMDKFDLNTDDAENRKKCMAYLKNFIKKYEEGNFVKGAYIFGEVGSGKTFLLSAFANELIERGHQVIFVYLPDLINDLKDDFEKLNEKINELKEVEILILDDFGLAKMTAAETRDFLELIEDRNNIKSCIIISQLPINNWYDIFFDPTLADAIMDRLQSNSYKIELKGPSKRGILTNNID